MMSIQAIRWGTLFRVDYKNALQKDDVKQQIVKTIGQGHDSLQGHDVFVGFGENDKVYIATGEGPAAVDDTVKTALKQIATPQSKVTTSYYQSYLFGHLPANDSTDLFTMTLPEAKTFKSHLKTETFTTTTGTHMWSDLSDKTWAYKPGFPLKKEPHAHDHHPLETPMPASDTVGI